MVDKSLILRKIGEMEEYLKQVREFQGISVEEFVQDWKIQRIVERTLHMMIETCVDIANHIISDNEYRIPEGYADTFRVLYEQKILTGELSKIMEKMAKFRNIIIHHYDKIDEEIVVGILKKHLDNFLLFKEAILTFLK
ncbi:MAG: type VII toxin-antitoxin system HepT family RNase toxin [bacterium]